MPFRSRVLIIWKSFILLILLAAASSMTAWAQAVITVTGTGADAGITFQIVTPVPIPSSNTGLTIVSSFNSCTVPSGESCVGANVDYSPGSGFLRLREIGLNHTWVFPQFLHNGTFTATNAIGGE